MSQKLRHSDTCNQVKSCTKRGRPVQSQWEAIVAWMENILLTLHVFNLDEQRKFKINFCRHNCSVRGKPVSRNRTGKKRMFTLKFTLMLFYRSPFYMFYNQSNLLIHFGQFTFYTHIFFFKLWDLPCSLQLLTWLCTCQTIVGFEIIKDWIGLIPNLTSLTGYTV